MCVPNFSPRHRIISSRRDFLRGVGRVLRYAAFLRHPKRPISQFDDNESPDCDVGLVSISAGFHGADIHIKDIRYPPRADQRGRIKKSSQFLPQQKIFDKAALHLFTQGHAALLPRGGGAYRGDCGGCPVGNLIAARDHMSALEGVPVRYIGASVRSVPAYMDVGVAALKHALLGSRINVYDPTTVELLRCLQNVHDVFGQWEWRDRLGSIARQFALSDAFLEHAA
jgi:hypothetical protein